MTGQAPDLHWRRWGEGAGALLLLHCSLASARSLQALAGHLNRGAMAPDMPGHGRSAPYDRSRDYAEQCLSGVLAGMPDCRVDVVGHSFGAVVAMHLALRDPGRVRRLVLIEPPLIAAARGRPEHAAYCRQIAPFFASYARGDRHEAARRFNAIWGTIAWADLTESRRADMAARIDVIVDQRAALFDDSGGLMAAGRPESLTCPALLMEGSRSPPVVAAVTAAMEARMSNAACVIIDGADHMGPVTHAADFAHEIAAFLDDAP